MAYDRWRINDFTRELDNIGAQIPMQPFGQGFRDMSPAVDKLERLVAGRKLCHGGNPILNMCAAGAVVQSDPAGNRKLHKAKSYSKIDGLVALAMALGCMSLDDLTQPSSPWDDPDFKLAVQRPHQYCVVKYQTSSGSSGIKIKLANTMRWSFRFDKIRVMEVS